jgi:prevent-host-death family protein
MEKNISAAQARRAFSAVLRRVRQGQAFVVTLRGRPVARIVPAAADDTIAHVATTTLFRRLSSAKVQQLRGWPRDELY